jgi:aryl-alcohol dehydrogenase-like predicted oxidoreductase
MALRDLIDHSPRRRRVLKSIAAGGAAAALAPLASRSTLARGPAGEGASSASSRAAGLQSSDQAAGLASQAGDRGPARVVRDGMVYRRLGRTGLHISEIALGGSPLPDETLLREIIDRGINYIDTSHSYDNGNSERLVGRMFRAVGRDKLMVHTRFHLSGRWTEASIIASVDSSLRRLGTERVDVLGIHGAENPADLTDERVLGAFDKLGAQGKYRFRGLTCHANHQAVVPRAVECGLYDMVQFGYNVFDIQETEKDVRTYGDYLGESGIRKLIDLAHGRDVGVIAMKVLKVGGRRQDLAKYKTGGGGGAGGSIQQAMLKWALENEKIAAVVTEILNRQQMEEDLGVAGRPLTAADRAALYAMAGAGARTACHMCGLCQAACPAGVRTTDIMRCLAYDESYGKTDRARAEYLEARRRQAEAGPGAQPGRGSVTGRFAAGEGGPADDGEAAGEGGSGVLSGEVCRGCEACDRACPYGIPVRERVAHATARLG